MKYLLLIAIALLVLWVLRQQRTTAKQNREGTARPPQAAPATPTEIVECRQCGLHLPRSEAIAGQQALYCGEAHRREAEGA